MSTTEAAFYDLAMTGDGEPAMLPLEESPWIDVYKAAANQISWWRPVVDLGCGTGRFAELLRRNSHGPYAGVDFSPLAIAEATVYATAATWNASFEVADLRDWLPDDEPREGTVYTILEVLEHLEDDVDLIRRIPVGYEVIFSVPNFGGEAHLRTFPNVSDAWMRYGDLLTFRSWQLIGSGPSHVHVYRAVRRGDAW